LPICIFISKVGYSGLDKVQPKVLGPPPDNEVIQVDPEGSSYIGDMSSTDISKPYILKPKAETKTPNILNLAQ